MMSENDWQLDCMYVCLLMERTTKQHQQQNDREGGGGKEVKQYAIIKLETGEINQL